MAVSIFFIFTFATDSLDSDRYLNDTVAMPARTTMMATTTRTSISVKAARRRLRRVWGQRTIMTPLLVARSLDKQLFIVIPLGLKNNETQPLTTNTRLY